MTSIRSLLQQATKALAMTSLVLAQASGASAQTLALSFDDGPNLKTTAHMSPAERNQAMLRALAEHGVTAVLFVTVNFGANRPEGLALARAWGQAGHLVGNHTMSHLDLDDAKVSLAQYQQEVLDCDAVIRTLPGYRKWLRFTYLHEGASPEKREGMRSFLRQQGYLNSVVSLDPSDWQLDLVLEEALAKNPALDLAPYKAAYLEQIWQRALASQAQAADRGHAEQVHMALFHHNLSNALWLGDAITMLKNRGWTFASPERTFAQQ